MSVHIKQISVKKLGPINEFSMAPGLVNLIYGRNESGKTCLVEFILRSLFRVTGRDTHWNVRDFSGSGKLVVTGLGNQDEEFTPKPRSAKLEDVWGKAGRDLPASISRLLVVKGAEPALDSKTAGGADRAVVKDYLSSQRILDEIQKQLAGTVDRVVITGNNITGDARSGELTARNATRVNIHRIDNLLESVEKTRARANVKMLRGEHQAVLDKIDGQAKARRHHAFRLQRSIEGLENEIRALPENVLEELGQALLGYGTKKADHDRKAVERKSMDETCRNHAWLEEALKLYLVKTSRVQASPSPIPLVLAALSFSGAIVATLAEFKIVAVLLIALGAGLGAWRLWSARATAPGEGDRQELEKLAAVFEEKFGRKLSDEAVIQVQLKQLGEECVIARRLDDEIRILWSELGALRDSIASLLEQLTGQSGEPSAWQKAYLELKSRRQVLSQQRESLQYKLERLGIQSVDFLENDPGLTHDPRLLADLETQKQKLEVRMSEIEMSMRQAKADIAHETEGNAADIDVPMEKLIGRLADKRAALVEQYQRETANIVAQRMVHEVLQELRQQEDEHIKAGLGSAIVLRMLQAVTRRYTGIELEEDELKVSDAHDSFLLRDLSTGAREQVLLALRMGFAARLAGQDSLFLVLDDAFQHSDWTRRKHLVDEVFAMSKLDWQILYFTMDDQIRDLFRAGGAGMFDLDAKADN